MFSQQSGFVWLVILSVFVVSAFFETKADVNPGNKYRHLTPEICANYLAGASPQAHGPRYSTYGLGRNPAPANLPNQIITPKLGFEIAPTLPAHPNLPPRGVAGWVEVDPATGQTTINGQPVGHQSRISTDEIVEACMALMSDK